MTQSPSSSKYWNAHGALSEILSFALKSSRIRSQLKKIGTQFENKNKTGNKSRKQGNQVKDIFITVKVSGIGARYFRSWDLEDDGRSR